MDPTQLDGISLILGALAAGAGSGLKDGAKDLAKDAVTGTAHVLGDGYRTARDKLVAFLRSKFGEDEDALADLNIMVRRPDPAAAEALAAQLTRVGLDHDRLALNLARDAVQQAGPMAFGAGSVAATVINSVNTGSGHSHVGGVQNYGVPPDPR
jgi:hypothetical protein